MVGQQVIPVTWARHEPRSTHRVLSRIDHQTPSDLAHLLRGLVRDHGPTFHSRARFRDGVEYNRELVHAAPAYEIWLLSWLPGQVTPIHDHGGAVTVTTVLSGTVLEERFERTGDLEVRPTSASLREIGDIDPIDPARIHRVRPIGNAVTLHLYVPTYTDGQIYTAAA
jgi:predicted metal-dependent enzyme (double-stranded beta helix superfamily)